MVVLLTYRCEIFDEKGLKQKGGFSFANSQQVWPFKRLIKALKIFNISQLLNFICQSSRQLVTLVPNLNKPWILDAWCVHKNLRKVKRF